MHQVNRGWGYLSSSLMGISLPTGWVPHIGPILAEAFCSQRQSDRLAGSGLLIYSGLGIRLRGLMFSSMSAGCAMNRHLGVISIISSLFMIYVAYLLWAAA
jgi:cytochrome c biogenesis protein CcdA